jgi:signal transduction histidine kinase
VLYDRIADHVLDEAEAELARQIAGITEAIGRHPDGPEAVAEFVEVEIGGSRPDLRLAIELLDERGESWLARDLLAPFTEPLPDLRSLGPGDRLLYRVERDDPYPYLVMVAPNGAGFTRAALYTGPYLRSVEEIRNLFLAAGSAALLLTGLLGLWLAQQSLRPIAEITAAARRIGGAPDGESIAVRGTGDELDRLAITLNGMLARIRRALERVRQFSGDAAHELRTPLSVVQTRLEVTLEKERSTAEYRRVLEETLADVEQLGEGVQSVLRLAKFEGGLEPGRGAEVQLRPLLDSVVEFFRPIAEEREIRLVLAAAGDASVHGDRTWLDRMFANLVDNAIKYSPPGGSVEVELVAEPEHASVSVRDSGPGIDASELERVFERFHRGSEAGARPGIGIGLTLAREIARAHRGHIEVEQRPGGGSIFRVRLPTSSASG